MGRAQVALVVTLFASALFSSACDRIKQTTATIGALIALSKDIGAKFDEPSVSCKLVNGTSLTIDVVNSSRRSLPDEGRRAAALEIARYAYAHFESRDQLSQVGVCFVHHWSIVVFTYNDATDLFSFTGSDLAAWYRQQARHPPDHFGGESERPPNYRLQVMVGGPGVAGPAHWVFAHRA